MSEKTIAAIATAPGQGGVAVVRVSGKGAKKIARKLFIRPNGKKGVGKVRYMHFGHITDDAGTPIDEAMAVLFQAPKSYTGQDVLELQCHGGQVQAQRVLARVLDTGAVLAEPGEFTKLAFLNGRIDLSQAEAVMQLIGAQSEKAAQLSQNQLSGVLSRKVSALADTLLDLMAAIGAAADYPEDDVDDTAIRHAIGTIAGVSDELTALLRTAKTGIKYHEGVRVVIAGLPNAGKSSLLNALLGVDRAIVTDIAGTTRDILSEPLNLNGVPVTLYDTAGLRASGDVIERIGVEMAKDQLSKADLVLLVRDLTQEWSAQDEEILSCQKPLILVHNKLDLVDEAPDAPQGVESVAISAKTCKGLDTLREKMLEMITGDSALGSVNLTQQRHADAVSDALASLDLALEGLKLGMELDVVYGDIRAAWQSLGLITGVSADDAVISRIFSTFCLGK